MAYFEDLSHYEYFLGYSDQYRNVGWLSAGHTFSTGAVSRKFIRNLENLRKKRTNLCRGYHRCELCRVPFEINNIEDIRHLYTYDMKHGLLGNGEIHVQGENDVIFAAPVLVVHYVKEHQYLPPAEFISAVENLSMRRFLSFAF